MINTTITIKNQITSLNIRNTLLLRSRTLSRSNTRKLIPKLRKHRHHKPRTIRPVSQTRTTINIRIPHKLQRKIHNPLSHLQTRLLSSLPLLFRLTRSLSSRFSLKPLLCDHLSLSLRLLIPLNLRNRLIRQSTGKSRNRIRSIRKTILNGKHLHISIRHSTDIIHIRKNNRRNHTHKNSTQNNSSKFLIKHKQ